jgi:hypothetical protein
MARPKSDRSQALAFKRLCREAGRDLDCAATAEVALTLATYRLARGVLTARLMAGHVINTNELLALDEAIKQILAVHNKAKPIQVDIQIINPAQTMCPKCDHVFDPENPTATAEKKKAAQTPRTIDGEATEVPPAAKSLPAPQKAAKATPAAPPLRENYFNAGPMVWHGYMDGRREYGAAASPDPHPYRNADGSERGGHSLPYPTPKG